MNKAHGFTIVELLVVIVVIAILASISYLVYVGIVGRANDTAVKSDLAQFSKQMEMYSATEGSYPAGGGLTRSTEGDSNTFPGITFKFTQDIYKLGGHLNLVYCTGQNSSDENVFRIIARSKSGRDFAYYSKDKSVKESLGGKGPHNIHACEDITEASGSVAWGVTEAGTWNNWALGV